ncbi:NUDIX domain-containing protein [Candidatus Saccharibacteria bacterium]|nr:NUDIX domain-containing protein [Candidatus Saccharibacteria bacterium]
MKNNEQVVVAGKIGAVVHITQPDGRVFEQYRRPPGTRLIIVSPEGKILITREHRHETGGIDLRLPGGKVCDTYEQYQALLASDESVAVAAMAGAIKEGREETGLVINYPELITVAKAGATVDWDLYYYLVRQCNELAGGQQLEHGENIEVTWMTVTALREAITRGEMAEWRSVGVLLGLVLPALAGPTV